MTTTRLGILALLLATLAGCAQPAAPTAPTSATAGATVPKGEEPTKTGKTITSPPLGNAAD